MSNEPLKVYRAVDPRIDLNQSIGLLLEEGGLEVTPQRGAATSQGNNTITWSNINPPSKADILDSKIYLTVPFRLIFSGVAASGSDTLLQVGLNDAPRAFPLNQAISSYKVDLNTIQITQNSSDLIEPLLRYSNYRDIGESYFSMTPSMQDQYLNYKDYNDAEPGLPLDGTTPPYGSALNVLGKYGQNAYKTSRGGFSQMKVRSDDGEVAIVDLLITEPILMSPFNMEYRDRRGFYGISKFQVIVNFQNDLGKYLWSHSDGAGSGTINSIQVNLTNFGNNGINDTAGAHFYTQNGEILYTTLTPKMDYKIPRRNLYPYRNTTNYESLMSSFIPGQSKTIKVQNLQLQSVPKRMYVFARRQYQDRSSVDTDTYLRIEGISVDFNNSTGMLSGASEKQLYLMSKRNGLEMSWDQWSKYTGSVLCIDFSRDLSLREDQIVGLMTHSQIRYNVTFRDIRLYGGDPVDAPSFNYQITTVIVEDGYMEIVDDYCYLNNAMFDNIENAKAISVHDVPWYESDTFVGSGINDVYKMVKDKVSSSVGDIYGLAKRYGENAYKFYKKNKADVDALVEVCGPEVLDLLGRMVKGGKSPTMGQLREKMTKKSKGGALYFDTERQGGKVSTKQERKRLIDSYVK